MAQTVLTYAFDSVEGSFIVTGASSIGDDGIINIPSRYGPTPEEEYDVRAIADEAFKDNESITKVICSSIYYVGREAFSNTFSLQSVDLGYSLIGIEDRAFDGNDMLSDIHIPSSVQYIGSFAFAGCISLSRIALSGKTEIREGAFKGCASLAHIDLSDEVTKVAVDSFEDTPYYNDINNWTDGGFYIGTHLICGSSEEPLTSIRPSTKIISGKFTSTGENIEIPGGVTYIAQQAFENCQNIKRLVIGEEVKRIRLRTFSGLSNLEKIIFKATNATCNSVTEAFENMGSQSKRVEIVIAKNVPKIPDYIFKQTKTSDVEIILTFENEHKCTSIGEYAFAKCGFKELTITGNIQTIDNQAFSECKSLESLVVSCPSITINMAAFQNCTLLKNLQLNEGVTEIQGHAFEGCAIKEIHIPNSTQKIDGYAFIGCSEIEKISTGNGVTDITFIQRAGATSNFTHLVIGDNVVEPKFTINQSSLEEVTIGKKYQVHDMMFYNCSGLKKVVLNEGLKKIGYSAFQDCISLSEITLPSGLEEIGNSAFANCGALQELTIPRSVKTMGDHAFQGCTGLKNISLLNARYSVIPKYAFHGCVSLVFISIPTNVDTIEEWAFYGCTAIINVIISEGTKIIKQSAFQNCSSLRNLTCPNSLTHIGRQALLGCDVLDTIDYQGSKYLGNSNNRYVVLLKTADSSKAAIHPATQIIYDGSLSNKTVTKLTIPPTVTCIGYRACSSNRQLQRVDIEAKNAVIDSSAFAECNGLAFYSVQPWSPSLQYYGATNSSYTFVDMPYLDMDYLGFIFNGKHSYLDLKALRTSDGDRYNINLTPETTDLTAETPSADGAYYFNSYHKQKKFNLNLALERITDKDLREWRRFCSYKGLGDLIFDEEPYKVYTAKITGQPSLRVIPFNDGEERVYRGEIALEFTCYWPYAHTPNVDTQTSPKKVVGGEFARDGRLFNSYIDYNRNLWKETSGLLTSGNAGAGENPGDLPAPFILEVPSLGREMLEQVTLAVGELEITIPCARVDITENDDGTKTTTYTHYTNIKWDSKTGIVSGKNPTDTLQEAKPIPYTGNAFGSIPVGGIDYYGIKSNITENGDTTDSYDSSDCTLTYDYWYY